MKYFFIPYNFTHVLKDIRGEICWSILNLRRNLDSCASIFPELAVITAELLPQQYFCKIFVEIFNNNWNIVEACICWKISGMISVQLLLGKNYVLENEWENRWSMHATNAIATKHSINGYYNSKILMWAVLLIEMYFL